MAYTVLSPKAIWSAAAIIVVIGIGVATWLLLAYGSGDPQAVNQLDAIKTAGTIVVGTGGAAALLLAARRQRTAEIALKHKEQDQADVARAHALQERVAADARDDATERRITELYTKAADQLGSEKAPVRLAGLYALERLAQNTVEQRQTVVNLLCAYLRMPYTPPADSSDQGVDQGGDQGVADAHRALIEEREVRLTAQRIIARHLRPAIAMFWNDIDLDLTAATLIDFSLDHCELRTAQFTGARFSGDTYFEMARFSGTARFSGARFTADAWFGLTQFDGDAVFGEAWFRGDVQFSEARFGRDAVFSGTQFSGMAQFGDVRFGGDTTFAGAGFSDNTVFGRARFGDVAFTSAELPEARYAGTDTPQPWIDFTGARFPRGVPVEVDRLVPPDAASTGGGTGSADQ